MSLETERLLLRRWKPGDSEPFAKLNSDPAVIEFLPNPLSRDESDALIKRLEAHFEENGFGFWAVEIRKTGEFIGFTGLSRPAFSTRFTPCVEVGWRLAKEYWGKGLATEAARAALQHGFHRLGLKEIVSFTVPANLRSMAVMERLGMKRDANEDFEHPRVPEGHPLRPHVLYRLKHEDFVSPHSSGAGSILIDEMRASDLEVVAELAAQLGYPEAAKNIQRRFEEIAASPFQALFVARSANGRVTGWVQVNKENTTLAGEPRAEVSALVVDEKVRGQKIGSFLLERAEGWAKTQNLLMVRIRSNVIRHDAHRFYTRHGYSLKKSWHLFTKKLV